jgi:hypothetical protein
MPVARAAFFATRLSPAPVLRIVCFADFTTFVVLDFLRLAILFPPGLGRGGMSALSPFYPQLRTLVGAAGTAVQCQKRP